MPPAVEEALELDLDLAGLLLGRLRDLLGDAAQPVQGIDDAVRDFDVRTWFRHGVRSSGVRCGPTVRSACRTRQIHWSRSITNRALRRAVYEQPLVAPQLGQAWQEPARCMMSPQT